MNATTPHWSLGSVIIRNDNGRVDYKAMAAAKKLRSTAERLMFVCGFTWAQAVEVVDADRLKNTAEPLPF